MLQNKFKFIGAMLVCLTIIALSYTVIQQRQQLNEQQVFIYHSQNVSIGFLNSYLMCRVKMFNMEKELETKRRRGQQ